LNTTATSSSAGSTIAVRIRAQSVSNLSRSRNRSCSACCRFSNSAITLSSAAWISFLITLFLNSKLFSRPVVDSAHYSLKRRVSCWRRAFAGTQTLLSALVERVCLLMAPNTIPIVFVVVNDPVGQGFISNLAHSGGNVTGFSFIEPEIVGKWVNLLVD